MGFIGVGKLEEREIPIAFGLKDGKLRALRIPHSCSAAYNTFGIHPSRYWHLEAELLAQILSLLIETCSARIRYRDLRKLL